MKEVKKVSLFFSGLLYLLLFACTHSEKRFPANQLVRHLFTHASDSAAIDQALIQIGPELAWHFDGWDTIIEQVTPSQRELMYRVAHAWRNQLSSASNIVLSVEDKKELKFYFGMQPPMEQNIRINPTSRINFHLLSTDKFQITWEHNGNFTRFNDTLTVSPSYGLPDLIDSGNDWVYLETSGGMKNRIGFFLSHFEGYQLHIRNDVLGFAPQHSVWLFASPVNDRDTLLYVENFRSGKRNGIAIPGCDAAVPVFCLHQVKILSDSIQVQMAKPGNELLMFPLPIE